MKAVAVHRGSRDGYQVARALHDAGLLETLVTDLYWPSERNWAQRVERAAPPRLSAALRCRRAEGLPAASVTSGWLSGMSVYMANEQHWLPFDGARAVVRWCDRSLGRRAGKIATARRAGLLAYSYYGHSAFSSYAGQNPRILFQLHPHPASVRSILQQERQLHPECAPSLDKEWELALSELDFRHLADEAAMAQHWIAASSFTKSTLVDAGIPADKIAVIPYGIDSNRFSTSKRTRQKRDPLRLLFVGTLGQRKGVKYLVEALNLLPPGSVDLTVCGRAVDDLSIFRNTRMPIHVYPSVSAQGLLDAYRNADVFVFPSLAEGFAQVLLEAMASGLPVISTARTAAPDLIQPGHEGFIVNPGSSTDLAQSIERFLRRPELVRPMGEAARRRAEHFTWRRFRQGIAQFVGGVLNQPAETAVSKTCLSC
jgi:glycosyltransferase involved in cell wall biosynthesis